MISSPYDAAFSTKGKRAKWMRPLNEWKYRDLILKTFKISLVLYYTILLDGKIESMCHSFIFSHLRVPKWVLTKSSQRNPTIGSLDRGISNDRIMKSVPEKGGPLAAASSKYSPQSCLFTTSHHLFSVKILSSMDRNGISNEKIKGYKAETFASCPEHCSLWGIATSRNWHRVSLWKAACSNP